MKNPTNNIIIALLAYLAQRDISPDRLCKLSDIDPQWILNNDRQLLSDKQVNDLWINAVHLSKDPYLGLHFGESLQLAALGIVGELIKSSNSVGVAITAAAELGHLVTNLFKMRVKQTHQTFSVYIEPLVGHAQNPVAAKHTLDVLMVMVIHELDGLLMKKISPLNVSYNSETQLPAEYERVLRCKPTCSDKQNQVTFDINLWNEPVITANYELQSFLKDKINAYTSKNHSEDKLSDKVRHYLMSNAYLGIGSLEDVASNFNISGRTLQRRLKDEKANFQQIADSVRQELAVQAITQGKYSVKEVAFSLGYNELSAFSRAFKRWTRVSPDHYKTATGVS